MKVSVLWNGGVDTYIISPHAVRDMTLEEIEACQPGGSNYYFPVLGDSSWLRCKFLPPAIQKQLQVNVNQCVRITARLGGHD